MAMIIFGIIGLILGICCVIGAGFLSGYEEILLQVAHFDSTILTVCLILMGVAWCWGYSNMVCEQGLIMVKIRRNTFETNSSSTHSLSIPKESVLTNNDDIKLLQLEGIITPFRYGEYDGEFLHIPKEDIIGKLRYLYSAFLQNGRENVNLFREIQKYPSITT